MAEATSSLHEVLHSLDTTICQSYHSNSFVDLLQLQGKFDIFTKFQEGKMMMKNIAFKSNLALETS